MQVIEETDNRLVIKNTPSRLGLILLGLGLVFAFFALIFSAAVRGVQPSGQSRAPAGAAIFVFPVGGLFFLVLDWRFNRRKLIMNSELQFATVRGGRTYKIPYDKIEAVCLGKTAVYNVTRIEFALQGGRRFSTGIEVHRGKEEDAVIMAQKLTAKLKQSPPIPYY